MRNFTSQCTPNLIVCGRKTNLRCQYGIPNSTASAMASNNQPSFRQAVGAWCEEFMHGHCYALPKKELVVVGLA